MRSWPHAPLIIIADHIYTSDSTRPVVRALAARDGRIAFAGDSQTAWSWRGTQTTVLSLPGRTVVPGLADAHAHLLGLGQSLQELDLTGAPSYEAVIRRVAARAESLPPGTWIRAEAGTRIAGPTNDFRFTMRSPAQFPTIPW